MGRFILWIVLIGVIFAGGYVVGIITSDDPSLIVTIQAESGKTPPAGTVITDTEDMASMDSLLGILLRKESADKVSVDKENPDASLKVLSQERSIGLADYQVWYTEEGAVLGEQQGNAAGNFRYYSITERDRDYIRSLIGKE
ncbi:hypothetical protein SAMN04487936_101556 [Halobacillus dabanensis]|uniref:Uncharacterized protein n=1 Tax=Halobacillus dabanensis TaxID=240302 RepID=A0A1I3Q6E8_HALDA|nr:hypothetical protein [Halobacillus dabanensis]SFJ29250.1 hypothetical protein SAMN04487936_101556 [Halobacillus dabanensis]